MDCERRWSPNRVDNTNTPVAYAALLSYNIVLCTRRVVRPFRRLYRQHRPFATKPLHARRVFESDKRSCSLMPWTTR